MKYLSSLVIVVNLAAGCHGSYIVSSGSKTRSVSAPTNSVAPLATSGSHVALPTSSPASYSSAASDKAFSTSSPCASLASNSGLKDSENASKTYNSPSFSKNTVPKVAVGQKPTNTPFSTTTSVGAAAAPTKLVDPIKKSDDGKVAPAKDADAILQKHDPSKNVFDRPGAKKDLNDPNQGYRHKFGKNSPGHKKSFSKKMKEKRKKGSAKAKPNWNKGKKKKQHKSKNSHPSDVNGIYAVAPAGRA